MKIDDRIFRFLDFTYRHLVNRYWFIILEFEVIDRLASGGKTDRLQQQGHENNTTANHQIEIEAL